MNKLPEVLIQEILSFLYKPSDCVIKGYDKFFMVDSLTYKLSKKLINKCKIDNILNRKICKIHCKAYPIYKKLDKEFKKQKRHTFVHFKTVHLARFALNLYSEKFVATCCSGKGLRKKNCEKNFEKNYLNKYDNF